MDPFYDKLGLIVDPVYDDIQAYAVDYDYDLLGRPLPFMKGFWANHLFYFRELLEPNPSLISAIVLAVVFLSVVLLYVWPLCLDLMHRFLRWSYIKQQIADERKYASPVEDPDRYAAIYCRATANRHGIANPRYPTPKDLPDYESVRFVYPQLWLMDKTHEALRMNTFHPVCDHRLEGELGAAIMMALEQKRMLMRRGQALPVSFPPPQPFNEPKFVPCLYRIPGPEMELIDAWIDLYRQRCREAAYENYQWWVSQDKTLPLESMERTGRVRTKYLRDIVKSEQSVEKKKKAKQSEKDKDSRSTPISKGVKLLDLDESALLRELKTPKKARVAKTKHANRSKSPDGSQKRWKGQSKKNV